MHFYDVRVRFVVLCGGYYWKTIGVATTLHFAKTLARRFVKKHPYLKSDIRIYDVDDLYKYYEADCFYVPRVRAPYLYLNGFDKWTIAARGWFLPSFEYLDDDDV